MFCIKWERSSKQNLFYLRYVYIFNVILESVGGVGGYTHVILYILHYVLRYTNKIVFMIVNKQSIALIHIIYSDCIGVPLCESSIHRYIFNNRTVEVYTVCLLVQHWSESLTRLISNRDYCLRDLHAKQY